MIVIPKDKPWPEYQYVNQGGIPIVARVNAGLLIADKITDWIRQTGYRPTHIILPKRFKDDFKASIDWYVLMAIEPAWPAHDEPEFMGLKLIISDSQALELLGDLPA